MPYESYSAYRLAFKSTPKENLLDQQIAFIEAEFAIASDYKLVTIDTVSTGVRFALDSKDSSKAEVIIQSGGSIHVGSYVVDGSDSWLAVDVVENVVDKGILRYCNNSLTLQTSSTQTQIGTDSVGRPVYEITPVYTSWKCVATSAINNPYDNMNNSINLPEGRMEVTIPYVNNAAIADNAEFSMWGYIYKVIGIDRTKVLGSVGIIKLSAQRVIV